MFLCQKKPKQTNKEKPNWTHGKALQNINYQLGVMAQAGTPGSPQAEVGRSEGGRGLPGLHSKQALVSEKCF